MQFEIGDSVYVKLQPYRQTSIALRKNQKLGSPYFGPFPMVEKIRRAAYKLQLPKNVRTKNPSSVPHFSVKKICGGSGTTVHPLAIIK